MDSDEMKYYLWQLKNLPFDFYLYQEEQFERNFFYNRGSDGRRAFLEKKASLRQQDKLFMECLEPKDLGEVKYYSYSDMQKFTDNFSDENFIQKTHTGRLFRVKCGQFFNDREATIKVWDFPMPIPANISFNLSKFNAELLHLSKGISQYTNAKHLSHPNLVKLVGYSLNKVPVVVYDLQSVKCVENVLISDSFDWNSRIKVALQMADLLCYLHHEEIAIKSISSRNIMIDKDGNAKLFASGLSSVEASKAADPNIRFFYYEGFSAHRVRPDLDDMSRDILMYGCVLLELLAKKVLQFGILEDFIKKCRDSLQVKRFADEALEVDDATANVLTDLALECVDPPTTKNLTMKEIFEKLKSAIGANEDHKSKRAKVA